MTYRIAVPATATLRHTIRLTLLALLSSIVSLTPLHAAVLFTFEQVGSDVVATTSGSILGGWTTNFPVTPATSNTRGVIAPFGIYGEVNGGVRFLSSGDHWTNNNQLTDVPTDTSGTLAGDPFGYSTNENFYVPVGTSEGDAFTPNTTITWAGETFESMGLDTGLPTTPLLLFTLDNGDTISAVRAQPVPEPTSVGFLAIGGLAAGVVAAARRRRRIGTGSEGKS